MGLLRNRDDNHIQFKMREDPISIGDDYWIEDNSGDRVCKANGKAARVRDTYGIEIYDPSATVMLLAITVAVDALSHDRG